jgi:hypothetical protein
MTIKALSFDRLGVKPNESLICCDDRTMCGSVVAKKLRTLFKKYTSEVADSGLKPLR